MVSSSKSPSKPPSKPRVAALVGPYLSGKTTLLESMLATAGAIQRKGSVKEGNTVGDATPEARKRRMSTEISIATTDYLGEEWTFIDCPGSIELAQDAHNALMVADVAVIVCEPDVNKAMTVSPLFRFLDAHDIPHLIFINKMDVAKMGVKATLDALQSVSERPLVLREIPIRDDGEVTGHVDLVSKRAFQWSEKKPSELMPLAESDLSREQEARSEMLESLADFDDALLESLLEDAVPPTDEVYATLARDLQQDLIVPVFFGSAERSNGILRLLKALRHEAPEAAETAERLFLEINSGETALRVFKTLHAGHTGKLSLARVWSGLVTDGQVFGGEKVGGLNRVFGHKLAKIKKAAAGEVVALGRMDGVASGDLLTSAGGISAAPWDEPLKPLFSLAIHAENRSDEVKLSGALAKIIDEDPSISTESSPDTGELLLWGQGEMHLLIALDRLKDRYNMLVASGRSQVPYKETIRKPISRHARHKKQSGGHGQFADVYLDIKPRPRGAGFEFLNTITGGVVPKQYIPAVEHGVAEYMARGPLGFPVVDISVTLTDGQFHSVDSSDMSFKQAAMLGMREGMPDCRPVLLEPVLKVIVSVPCDFTSKAQRLVSGRRGQILGFDAKPGWKGWDEVMAQIPQTEMHDLIIDLRSATLGVGTFEWSFDHLQELSGKVADGVIADRAAALNS